MSTLYMIEQGWYSDRRLIGIYDSEDKAKTVVDMINAGYGGSGDEASYSEVDLNAQWDMIGRGYRLYSVLMSRDGTSQAQLYGGLRPEDMEPLIGEWYWNSGKRIHSINAEVWAKDEKHAVKIMNEHRAKAIAEGNL